MKYKKQIRWLIFLMIPVITLLSIHFIVPLTILLQSYPIVEESYQDGINRLWITNQRSTVNLLSDVMNAFFEKYINNQNTLLNLFSNNNSQMVNIITDSINFSNAYLFGQQIINNQLPLSTTENASMWFATNASTVNQLSTAQEAMMNQYKQLSVYLQPVMFGINDSFIYSWGLYMVDSNKEALYFQYPSRYKQSLSNLTTSLFDQSFNQTVGMYHLLNNATPLTIPFLSVSTSQGVSLMMICSPSSTQNLTVVGCVYLNLNLILDYFYDAEVIDFQPRMTNFLILNNNQIGNRTLPRVAFAWNNKEQKRISSGNNYVFRPSTYGLPNSIFNSTPSATTSHYYVWQNLFRTEMTTPVLNTSEYISFRLVQHMTPLNLEQNSDTLAETTKKLVIPIVMIILFVSICSCLGIRKLLNGIDGQLVELDKRLALLSNGDIHVEIIQHFGTKDIKYLYDEVRIINKLHRYSTQAYFTGHNSEKMLKYNEALQFIRTLNYDPGNLLENMGEACLYLEDWQRAFECLKQSVTLILEQIQTTYGKIDELLPYKKTKHLPHKYKQMQLVLIRRLFKLNLSYLRYFGQLEMLPSFKKKYQSSEQRIHYEQKEKMVRQSAYYLMLQNKAFYPDYAGFSECIIMLLFQCKQFTILNDINQANVCLDQAFKVLERYTHQYEITGKSLIEKTKHKLFQKKNKLTTHSRAAPDVLKNFAHLMKAKLMLSTHKGPMRYLEACNILFSGVRVKQYILRVMYLTMLEIRQVHFDLNIPVELLESTQLFRQVLPFKTLSSRQASEQSQSYLLKYPTVQSEGLEKQYVLVFDCGKEILKASQNLIKYHTDRVNHIYNKIIRDQDRVSIIKYHTKVGVQLQCGLLIKSLNENLIKKALDQVIVERYHKRKKYNEAVQAFIRAFQRVKHLQLEKVIIMFFKPIEQYKEQFKKIIKRQRKYSGHYSRTTSNDKIQKMTQGSAESLLSVYSQSLGTVIQDLLLEEDICNLKIILYCAKSDPISQFREFFNLNQINRRIWSKYRGVNVDNNVVYVVESKHKSDIDRILMLKTQRLPDNNIFVL